MTYFISFTSALVLSAVLAKFLQNLGIRHGIVSVPRSRDIHKKPIPRIGGMAILLSFLLVSAIFFFLHKEISFGGGLWLGFDRHLLAIWMGGFLISVSMLIDDIFGLKAWQKFILQAVAAFIVIASGIGINTLPNPFGDAINLNSVYIPLFTSKEGIVYHFSLWSDLLTFIWIVGMMNVINFIDGVDGLAGGVSGIAAMTLFLLSISAAVNQPAVALVSIVLAGSCFGFLVWNFPPAKIFMGDSGSAFLGFMLGVLPLISGGKLATAFLVLGFPIVDGLFVFLGRMQRRENPFTTPDKTHLHHRFLKAGFSPRQAILFIYLISAAFGWVALRSTTLNKIIAAILMVFFLFLITQYLNLQSKKKISEI